MKRFYIGTIVICGYFWSLLLYGYLSPDRLHYEESESQLNTWSEALTQEDSLIRELIDYGAYESKRT